MKKPRWAQTAHLKRGRSSTSTTTTLVPQPIAGMRADGKSQLNFLNITMTARGLLRIPDGNSDNISDDVTVGSDPRGYNESARDARMYISKPIMLNQ